MAWGGTPSHAKMPEQVAADIKAFKNAPFTAFLPSFREAVIGIDEYYFDMISRKAKYREDCARAVDCDDPAEGLRAFLRTTPEFLQSESMSTGVPRHFTAHQKAVSLSTAIDRFEWGANRGGKTFHGAIEAACTAYGEPLNPALKTVERPGRVWACCPDYQNSGRVVQVPMIRWALGKYGKWKEAQRRFEVRSLHGEETDCGDIFVKGYDSGPEKFAGADVDLIWNDEPPPEPIYQEQGMRIGEGQTRFLWTLTLVGANAAWIIRRFYRQWLDDGRPKDPCWVNFALDDNPYLDKSSVEKVKERYKDDPEQAEIRIKGGMPQMSGFLYPMLAGDVHVIDDFEIPGVHREPEADEVPWTLYRFIDPGIRNECFVGWMAVAPDQTCFIYREFCESDHSIPEVCSWMRAHETKREIFKWSTIDIAAAQRDLGTGDTRTQIFAKNGVICMEASNREVDTAVSTMREAFSYSKDDDGNWRRRPKIVFFRSCPTIFRQCRNAAWKPKASRSEEDPKEVTLKKDDHGENALRYLMCNFNGPRWFPREETEHAAVADYQPDQTTGYW